VIESAATKPARRYTVGERIEAAKLVRDDVYVQDAVGRAETRLAAARAYYFHVMGDLWVTLLAGRQPSERQVALFTAAYCARRRRLRGCGAARLIRRQAARPSIRRDHSIAACATS